MVEQATDYVEWDEWASIDASLSEFAYGLSQEAGCYS